MYGGLVEALHVLKGATNEVKFRRLIKLRVASIRDRRRVLYERLLKGILKLRYSSHILFSTSYSGTASKPSSFINLLCLA